MTANEIIIAAYQELGITVSGGSPNANDLAWGLGKLNRFLNSLSADGLNLYCRVKESFNLVSGTASYTIGAGAVFDTARPTIIEQAFIRISNHDYLVKVRPIAEYWTLTEKTTQDRPAKLYHDPTYPNGTIYLYYTPDSSYSLHLISQKPLTVYVSGTTDVLLPGEYEDAIVLNLALRIASRYGKEVSNDLRLDARNAYNNVKALNLANQMKAVELNLSGDSSSYNVNAG